MDATQRKAVRLVVVVAWVAVRAVEVQVVAVVAVVLRATPIVPVAALVVQRAVTVVAIAAGRQEHTPTAVSSRYKITALCLRTSPTLSLQFISLQFKSLCLLSC